MQSQLKNETYHKVGCFSNIVDIICSSQCSMPYCIGSEPSECLECEEKSFYRHLDTWACQDQCNLDENFLYSFSSNDSTSILKLCKSNLLDVSFLDFTFYVDSNSSKNYEFGT